MIPTVSAVLAAPFVGSFLSLLVHRIPYSDQWIFGRSRCTQCGHALNSIDLVPFVSFAVMRGKCRYCGQSISGMYFTIELAAVVVCLWAIAVVPTHLIWPTCIIGWTLIVLSAIDIRHHILPDGLNAFLALTGLTTCILYYSDQLLLQFAGALFGFGIFFAIGEIYHRVRGRPGLGMGDAKLMAAGGFWIGAQGILTALFIASLSALAFVAIANAACNQPIQRQSRIPFGPFLSLGIWMGWIYGPVL